jgi:hypothetical protein
VGVRGIGVIAEVGIAVSVGMTLVAGVHEAKIKRTSKTVMMFFIFIDNFLYKGLPNSLRYWCWVGVDSVWEQEKLEARKMLTRSMPQNPQLPVYALLGSVLG